MTEEKIPADQIVRQFVDDLLTKGKGIRRAVAAITPQIDPKAIPKEVPHYMVFATKYDKTPEGKHQVTFIFHFTGDGTEPSPPEVMDVDFLVDVIHGLKADEAVFHALLDYKYQQSEGGISTHG